jgi:hypothetical protein
MLLHSSKRAVAAAAFALILSLGLATPSWAFLDKTRFVAHLGVAYFAFHHWVMRPYEAGAFTEGAPHRTSTIVKGGVALLFAVHEVRVAEKISADSKDPLLQKVHSTVVGLGDNFAAIGQKFKSGQFRPEDITALRGATSSVSSASSAAGIGEIKDKPVPIPGV